MSKELLTHKGLAEMLGVSETTVKSYRRKFPGCIPVASEGKPIRFTEEAARVAVRIRDLFATGMSVPEVRRRLAEEFDWISAQEPKQARAGKPAASGVTPELTLGVSNMAKSMVTMTGQQKTILERVRGIESILEELGVQGVTAGEAERQKRQDDQRDKELRLEDRLSRMDATTQGLAASLAQLAEQFGRFVEHQGQLVHAPQHGATPPAAAPPEAPCAFSPVSAVLSAYDAIQTESVLVDPHAMTDISTPTEEGTQAPPREEEPASPPQATAVHIPFPEVPATVAMPVPTPPAEPSRVFFSMPLVVQHADGNYVNARGRSKGRFCLNDLKAVLVYGFTPPHHFIQHFEQHQDGWWLSMTQPEQETPKNLALYLMERMTQNGIAVVEICRIKVDGALVAPAEIGAILDSLTE